LACRYDLLHNHHLQLNGAPTLYELAKALADDVIPSEYGITPKQKFRIGSCITHKLLVNAPPPPLADVMMLPSSAHADVTTLPKVDSNCTAPALDTNCKC
jgi:hypothetical protein